MAQMLRLQGTPGTSADEDMSPQEKSTRTAANKIDTTLPDEFSVQRGRPIVFGPPARPISGRLHETRATLRGAVVLCAPWGYEENCASQTFCELARELADAGYEVLRFDYDGCGNSYGDAYDAKRIVGWTSSCALAIEFMARRTGCKVNVVGLRLGAALAVLASADCHIGAAVLWDPVVSGKRYLRALRAMSIMGVEAAPDPNDPGSLVTIGNPMTSATVAELEALNLQGVSTVKIEQALIISRPGAADPRRLTSTLEALGVKTTAEDHMGTEKLLDGPAEQSVMPLNVMRRIVDFIKATAALSPATRRAPLPSATQLEAPDGSWVEHHYTLGAQSLYVVLTVPRDISREGVVVMTNNGVARSIGPARVWVLWARQLAALGICSLRLDFSGLGDSGVRPGQTAGIHYPVDAIDDLQLVVSDLATRLPGPAFALGLCSGAFLNLDAMAAGAGLSGAVSINPQLFYVPDAPGSPHSKRRAAPPTHPWVQRFMENTRVGRRLARLLPFPAWWMLARLRLQPSPIRGAAAAAGVAPVLLIYGNENLGLERLEQRDPGAIRQWVKKGQMVIVDGLDHSMFDIRSRQQAEALTQQFLLKHLPPRTGAA